jgi:HEPN domain-containing protein
MESSVNESRVVNHAGRGKLVDRRRSPIIKNRRAELKRLYEVTVFYCQQALEKLLKGTIIALNRERPKKTHRLIELYQNVEANVPLEDDLKDFLHIIAPYYFTARYPDVAMGLPEGAVTKNFALESLEKTRRIFECFDKKLPKA